jgi:lysophospholipase L1-like esterase
VSSRSSPSPAPRLRSARLRAPRLRAPRLRAIGLGLALPLLILAALELALRASGYPDDLAGLNTSDNFVRNGMFAPDDRCLYRLAAGYRRSAEHAGTYALDAWPWRGRPALPAPPRLRRVAVVGDSCAFGIGLEVRDTLPELLAHELDARGYDPGELQVVNLGVPGYSSAQIESVLAWALGALHPDAVVIYAAAWNDSSPAWRMTDAELVRRRGNPWSSAALELLRTWVASAGPSWEEVTAAEKAGQPLFGTRVPREAVEPTLARTIAAATSADCKPIVLVPAHPRATLAKRPRLAQDRESVRRAARAAGAALVDTAEAAAQSGLPDEALFVDFVHPSRELWGLVVEAIADAVVPALAPAEPAGPAEPRWTPRASPAELPAFGDAPVAIDLAGWSGWAPGEALPVVTIGGAPLLDPRLRADSTVVGTAPMNSPGEHDLVVQSARAIAFARGAVRLLAPRLELDDDGSALVLRARPGDRAHLLFAGGLSVHPAYTLVGASMLDPAKMLPDVRDVVCGSDGRARLELPPGARGSARALFAQAQVAPRGVAPGTVESRTTGAVRIAGDEQAK